MSLPAGPKAVAGGLSPVRAALLGLLGGDAGAAGALDPRSWRALSAMAAEHRLQPLLAGMLSRGELAPSVVPPPLAAIWQTAARDQAILALVQRHALRAAAQLLGNAGLRCVALKGAWLAAHAYPTFAERPLRDIDLLLPGGDLLPAWHVLREHGWTGPDLAPATLLAFARHERHLPPLISPGGVAFELHGALHDPHDRRIDARPLVQRMLAGAAAAEERGDPARYPPAEELLAHLCIHAAYSHQFDAGPLILADVDRLVARCPVDWARFWRDARDGRYVRGAAVCLALTDRWRRPGLLAESCCPVAVADEPLLAAAELLLQPAAARRDVAL